jgi:hypothetical protein
MDVHVKAAVTLGLRQRGVTVLTAHEGGTGTMDDPDLLDRATALGHVLFSQGADFLAEAARRQAAGTPFSGLIYAHQQRVSIGQCIADLELLAQVYDLADMLNRVEHLPL